MLQTKSLASSNAAHAILLEMLIDYIESISAKEIDNMRIGAEDLCLIIDEACFLGTNEGKNRAVRSVSYTSIKKFINSTIAEITKSP